MGPSLSSRSDSRSSRSCWPLIEFPDKRFQWLMNFDALHEKTKCRRFHRANAEPLQVWAYDRTRHWARLFRTGSRNIRADAAPGGPSERRGRTPASPRTSRPTRCDARGGGEGRERERGPPTRLGNMRKNGARTVIAARGAKASPRTRGSGAERSRSQSVFLVILKKII
jgi:hypothetical protein